MPTHPVLATLVGTVPLSQALAGHEWAGITVAVAANGRHGRRHPSRS